MTIFAMTAGKPIDGQSLPASAAEREIVVAAEAEGIPLGGMTSDIGGGYVDPNQDQGPHFTPITWSVRAESVDSADAVALLRDYFAELTVRYFHRETTDEEIDETLDEYPSTGLALFLLLRAGRVRAGCLGLHPTGEITRMYVSPRFRRRGGARALLTAAESWARSQGLTRLFLDTRTDLGEARAFYASCGFIEIPPATSEPGPYQDHWFEKPLT